MIHDIISIKRLLLVVLPEYRRLYAISLLKYAYERANANSLMLLLQTFVSGELRYFTKYGFAYVYKRGLC